MTYSTKLALLHLTTADGFTHSHSIGLPEQLRENTHASFHAEISALASQFQIKLQSVLNEKYVAKSYSLTIVLEKDRNAVTAVETTGVT